LGGRNVGVKTVSKRGANTQVGTRNVGVEPTLGNIGVKTVSPPQTLIRRRWTSEGGSPDVPQSTPKTLIKRKLTSEGGSLDVRILIVRNHVGLQKCCHPKM
jgi:hypothetical protein